RTLVHGSSSDQRYGEDGEKDWQYEFHYRASLRTGSMTGNSMCSNFFRRSGSSTTSHKARMLLPMGSVPHRNPSNAVGGVPFSVGCAGGMPSLTHRLTLPRS